MTQAHYPIDNTADEFTRLGIQADLFREDARSMLARIGNGSGWRVLDLCCGIGGITDVLSDWVGDRGSVVGVDRDTAKLEHARQWARENRRSNIEFAAGNAFDTGLAPQSFDLVHSRFAISVIENGIGILDHMLTLVRPGGIVSDWRSSWGFRVEEANTHTMQCDPPTKDWERALALMQQTFRAVGADTGMGIGMRRAFIDRGLGDIIMMKPCLHALTAADPMTMHLPMTLYAMSDTITSKGLMPAEELSTLIARVTDHLAQPGTMTISFSTMQVAGRSPG